MNLGHRAIDSPTCSHLAPVEHKLLLNTRERLHGFLLILLRQKIAEAKRKSILAQHEAGVRMMDNPPLG
jgi:hypothetical protein